MAPVARICTVLVVAACALAHGAATEAPPAGATLAWMRFEEGDHVQRYADTPYLFLGNVELKLAIDVKPEAGHALALRWGAKNDTRTARAAINGQTVALSDGGYDGFRWISVAIPEKAAGEKYEIVLAPGDGKAGFIAEVRLIQTGKTDAAAPDMKAAAHRIALKTGTAAPTKASQGEAFPEMRAQWDTPLPPPEKPHPDAAVEAAFREAEKNGRTANEALYRCRRFVDGWLAHADPTTGLIPRNLRESKDFWNGRDSAADNYPFMVLTCALTDRPLFEGRMLAMLRTETKLTCRVDRLPDDYSFSKKGWRREQVNLDAIIFDGAEYVKDGLIPITELLGPSPWSERAVGIIDDIWKHAAIETPSGNIPTLNFEVNGDLLQACSRLYWFTGERKYLDRAIRLGDYYLLGDHHPTRDLKELCLGDHSCEVVNGLSELYVAVKHAAPEKKQAYEKPLHEMYDRILEIARNEHGLIYLRVDNKSGKPKGDALTDNWGYNYDGMYTAYLVDGTTAYRDAVRKALSNIHHYAGKGGMCQSGTADGYADSIEGAINLLNREPDASAAAWVDAEIRTMWSKQKSDGVIEGWHGDGNSARTSIMYAFWKSQGLSVQPWRADVRLGAAMKDGALCVSLIAAQDWSGKLIADKPRHKTVMKLPLDYPRINQFPEWFVTEAEKRYEVQALGGAKHVLTGAQLQAGLEVTVKGGVETRFVITAGK
jgi:hypothetical protein